MRPRLALAVCVAMLALPLVAQAATNETIKLTTVSAGESETENGVIFTERVYRNGELVGTDKGVCAFKQGKAECKITIRLPEGKIILAASIAQNSNRGSFKVTGGTGEYRDASGTGFYRNLSDTRTRIVINLT